MAADFNIASFYTHNELLIWPNALIAFLPASGCLRHLGILNPEDLIPICFWQDASEHNLLTSQPHPF